MCGFTAIFAYRDGAPPVEQAELMRISQAMLPRGPDDDGLWINATGDIGMAHRRLAILDPSPAGHQPMTLLDDGGRERLVISYNGEIYNFRALRLELSNQGHQFRTDSDTEVLLHLYDRYGPEMVDHLRGMYAFAIWDRDRRGVFLARDPFGIKPLYYADDGKTLRAASQVKALQAGGAIANTVNPAGHVGFHMFGYVPEPHTLTKEIKALPAGCRLWVDGNGAGAIEKYFSLDGGWDGPADAIPLGDALRETMEHHLVSDVPVGVFLSAGLDSASLAGFASEVQGTDLQTITLSFDEFKGRPLDEAPLAEQMASGLGSHHHTVRVAGETFRQDYNAVLQAMDQPSIDGVNTYFVAKAAADAGLKVALSGVGGDELFGGYDSFTDIPKLVGRIGWMPGISSVGRAFRAVSGGLIGRLTSPKYAGIMEYSSSYGAAYLLRRGLYMPWELPHILDPDLVREGWRDLQPIIALDHTHAAQTTPHAKVSSLELAWYLRNQLLRDADWAGMAHSLEIRTPLVDATLFRQIAGLGATKRDMAECLKRPLPDTVLDRKKTGFFIPVREWLGGDNTPSGGERGLRGWSRQIYGEFTGTA